MIRSTDIQGFQLIQSISGNIKLFSNNHEFFKTLGILAVFRHELNQFLNFSEKNDRIFLQMRMETLFKYLSLYFGVWVK